MSVQRILIVEDDPAIAAFVQTALERERFKTELVTRGDLVLARVEASPPDLVLLDLMLPGMDGLQVCQAVRLRPQYIPNCPSRREARTGEVCDGGTQTE